MTRLQDECLESQKLPFPDTDFVTTYERKYYQTQLTSFLARYIWYKKVSIDALLTAQDILTKAFPSDVMLIVKGSTAIRWSIRVQHDSVPDADLDTMLLVRPGTNMLPIAYAFLAGTFLDWIENQDPGMVDWIEEANILGEVEHVPRPSMFVDYPYTTTKIQTRRMLQDNVKLVYDRNGRVGMRSCDSTVREVSFSNDWHKTYAVQEHVDGYMWLSERVEAIGTITSILPNGTKISISEDGVSPLRIWPAMTGTITMILNGKRMYVGKVKEVIGEMSVLDTIYLPREFMCACETRKTRPTSIQLTIQPSIETGTETFSLMRLVLPFQIMRTTEPAFTKAELLDISCTEGDHAWNTLTGADREKWTYKVCVKQGPCIRLVTLLYHHDDLLKILRERPEDKKTKTRINRLALISKYI